MGTRGFMITCTILARVYLQAHTVVDEDFRTGMGGNWLFFGGGHHEPGMGAVLLDDRSATASTLTFGELVESEGLKVSVRFTLEAGYHGLCDGLAIGLVAMPTSEILGRGEGAFGQAFGHHHLHLPVAGGAIGELGLHPSTFHVSGYWDPAGTSRIPAASP